MHAVWTLHLVGRHSELRVVSADTTRVI